MLFINTRPDSRAKSLSQCLQQHGIKVIELPLLTLVKKPLEAHEINALQTINQYQVVLLVSEEAVNYGLQNLAQHVDLSQLSQQVTWLAVGEKSAKCFGHLWQQLTDCPPPSVSFPTDKALQNNEGMLKMPILQALTKGDKVQIWRGVGGRELLADTLKSKAVQVDLLNFYQRILPTATVQKLSQWQACAYSKPVIVLISSLSAWQHWQQLTKTTELFSECHYLVLQQRIASVIVSAYPDLAITVISDLNPHTILQALTRYQ